MGIPLWDRIRALMARGNLYNAENLLANQTDPAAIGSGDMLEQSNTLALLEQTNLQINRLERYKDFEQMDEVGEITLALDLYADEASLMDPERKHSIFIRARSKKIKEELEALFYERLLIDHHQRSLIRYLVKFGDEAFKIIPTAQRDGVARIKHLNIYNFNRVETRQGDLVGFFYQDEQVSSPMFFHPWEVVHMRLTNYENIYHPYGRSLLDGARKAFKQLRLMEDAAIVYRLTRAPERRVFTIPVGNIPPRDYPTYIEHIARSFKRKQIYDPSNQDVTERWSPHIQEDDYWMPERPDGTGPKVDTLPGAENLDQIADIEYFKKKMIAALKIPFARVGIGEAGEDSKQSLSQVAPEFAKSVQWVQQVVSIGLKKIALVHLALRGYSLEDMRDFDIAMANSSAIDELYRIETWSTRADVMGKLKGLEYFPDEWIISNFTNLSEDEIQMIKEANKEQELEDYAGFGGEEEGEESPGEEAAAGREDITIESSLSAKELVELKIKDLEKNEKFGIANLLRKWRPEDYKYNTNIDFMLSEGEFDFMPQNILEDGIVVESATVKPDYDSTIDEINEAKNSVLLTMEANKEKIVKFFKELREGKQEDESDDITNKDIPK